MSFKACDISSIVRVKVGRSIFFTSYLKLDASIITKKTTREKDSGNILTVYILSLETIVWTLTKHPCIGKNSVRQTITLQVMVNITPNRKHVKRVKKFL